MNDTGLGAKAAEAHTEPPRRERGGRITILLTLLLLLAGACGFAWFWVTQPLPFTQSPRSPAETVDPRRLEDHVRALVAIRSRSFGYPEQLDRAAAYIRRRLEATGAAVAEQTFTEGGDTYRNLCARFGPEAGDRIVVGAHYDTADENPGADDNASGVAGLLELAILLGHNPPPTRVDLIAFTLEEPPAFGTGLMGSAHHAASLRTSGVRLRAMICLEMIGFFSERPNSQHYPLPGLGRLYPPRGDFIAVVGRLREGWLVRRIKSAMRRTSSLDVQSLNAPGLVPGVALSDHRAYWAYGYPAVMVTDTSMYRNLAYHSEDDLPETLDYARMAEVVAGLRSAVLELSGERSR